MAHTKKTIAGNVNNGTANTFSYSGSFDVFKASEVEVELDNVALTFTTGTINESANPREYTVDFTNKTVHIGGADLASTDQVVIQPVTDMGDPTPRATYTPGASVTSNDLNNNQLQLMRKAMEYNEQKLSSRGGTMTGNLHLGQNVDLSFEGDNDNAHEITLTVADPTSDKTITFPDTTGTVVTTGDTGTVSRTMIANDAINGDKIANDVINSEHYVASSIDTEHYAPNSVDTTALGPDAVTAAKLADNSVFTANISNNEVTREKINADAIDSSKLADNAVNSEHYVDLSIDEVHLNNNIVSSSKIINGAVITTKLSDLGVTTQKIAADAVTGAKIADDQINSEHYVDGSIDTAHIADAQITTAKIADANVTTAKIADSNITGAKISADAVDGTKIADNSINSEHYVDGSIDTAHIAGAQVTDAKLASNAVTTSKITDANVTTVKVADANITLAKLASDLKQTTISDSDTQLPTSGAVVDYVAAQIAPLGGLEVIADEDNFPTSQPSSGVVISISDAAGIVVQDGSGGTTAGRSTTARTAGNGSDNVTINNFPSSLHGETLATGVGLMVSSTGSGNIYNYHKILAAETDVKQLSDDINDFNARYRVGSSNPTSALDSGDLFFNTGSGKLLVYNGTASAWEEAQSIGQYFINTISSSSGTGGGSATFNGSAYRFTISNAGAVAEQHIVSVNGVVQKPNSGTSQPSEGFAIDGADIIFSSAPASSSDFFIITIGSTVNIGTPSNGTVTTDKLASGAVTTVKIADDAITTAKIADNSISSAKISDNQVTTAKIVAGAVTGAKLAADSVNTGNIVDAAVTTAKITDANVTTAKIADDAVTAAKLANSINSEITANTAKTSNATHTGEVTGSTALTIADNVVDEANLKVSNSPTNGYLLSAQSGNTGGLTWVASPASDVVDDSSPQLGAALDTNGYNINFGDSTSNGNNVNRLKFGTATNGDLEIYHDGSNSYITDRGTGELRLMAAETLRIRDTDSGEEMITCNKNGSVDLYYNNSKKFETTNAGFKTQGSGQVDVLIGSTNGSGAFLVLDGDANGDGSGGDYSYLAMTTSGELDLVNNKNEDLRFGNNGTIRARFTTSGHFVPQANNTYDLGSTGARWQNIYTNDLHLSNEGHSNDVDQTWGDWTIQEGESDLFLKNNRSGKKYKFNLTEVS